VEEVIPVVNRLEGRPERRNQYQQSEHEMGEAFSQRITIVHPLLGLRPNDGKCVRLDLLARHDEIVVGGGFADFSPAIVRQMNRKARGKLVKTFCGEVAEWLKAAVC
jgi:hypothetical protein